MIEFFRGTVTAKDWIFVAAVLAITAVLGVLFYFLLLTPQQAVLAEKQTELTGKKRQLQTAQANERNIGELRELAKYADRLAAQLATRLPNEQEFLGFMTKLEEISRRHDLNLTFEPGNSRSDSAKGLQTWPYEVEAAGDTHKILRFINDLEIYDRYVRVDDLDIQYKEAGVTEATFVVSTFRFLEAEPAPTASQAN
jgi:Tfp pilus assembly protein PilO